MKQDKGEQVFTGDTDEILADKIIKHTRENSKNSFSTQSEDTEEILCCPPKKIITILLAIVSSAALLLFLLSKLRKMFHK
jgi:hypothetical protein